MERDVRFEWSIAVPIFKNPLILKQLALAIGLPFGLLLAVFMLALPAPGSLYASGIVLALLLLTAIFVLIIYSGAYDVHYVIDSQGILCENSKKSAKRTRAVGNAAFYLGLATGNLSAAGAGSMSASRTRTYIKTKNIKRLWPNDKRRYILVNGGFGENIAVFCGDNYGDVKTFLTGADRDMTRYKVK